MNKLSEIEYRILLSLCDGDERFESIYLCMNNITYINHSTDPLYTTLYQFPPSQKYSVQEVFVHTKKIIRDGFIDCLTVVKNEQGDYSPQKVSLFHFDDFSIFATYWLNLTLKGKTEIDKDIYKDYYENFQKDNGLE